jgi:hypothetical protein
MFARPYPHTHYPTLGQHSTTAYCDTYTTTNYQPRSTKLQSLPPPPSAPAVFHLLAVRPSTHPFSHSSTAPHPSPLASRPPLHLRSHILFVYPSYPSFATMVYCPSQTERVAVRFRMSPFQKSIATMLKVAGVTVPTRAEETRFSASAMRCKS